MAKTADTWSWLPWRRHAEQKAAITAINGEIVKLQKTAEDIRADHGLDQLVIDIEHARARGERAMRTSDDQEKQRASQT